jgi:tetratricopeptide (TPR) repeat protein
MDEHEVKILQRKLILILMLAAIPFWVASLGSALANNTTAENAITKKESDPTHWFNKGDLLLNLDRYNESIEAYNRAIKLNQSYAAAWSRKGDALDSQKKYEEAIQAYDAMVFIDGSDIIAIDSNGAEIDRGTAGTDDVTVINAALAFGSIVFIKSGTYIIPANSIISLSSQNQLIGEGIGKTIFNCAGINDDVIQINKGGYSHTTLTLASDGVLGSSSIVLSNASTISIGDWIKIFDDEAIEDYKKGEILKVLDKTSNTLTLSSKLTDDYTTVRNAGVRTVTFYDNIKLEGITFNGPGEEKDFYLLSAYVLNNLCIRDCEFYLWGVGSLYLVDVINSTIEQCVFKNVFYTGMGYSVSLNNACNNIKIIYNKFLIKGRHYVEQGAITGTYCSDGWVGRVEIVHNYFEDSTEAAVDGHPQTHGPTIVSENVFESCAKGIKITNAEFSATSNYFKNCGDAIATSVCVMDRPIDISFNKFVGGTGHDLNISSNNIKIIGNLFTKTAIISGNDISFVANTFVGASDGLCGFGSSGASQSRWTVEGNTFSLVTYPIYFKYVDYINVSNNYLYGCGPIQIDHVSHLVLDNNNLFAGTDEGIMIHSGEDIRVSGNYLYSTSRPILLDSALVAGTPVYIAHNFAFSTNSLMSLFSGYTAVDLHENIGVGLESEVSGSSTGERTDVIVIDEHAMGQSYKSLFLAFLSPSSIVASPSLRSFIMRFLG